jgi:hypothetical protein
MTHIFLEKVADSCTVILWEAVRSSEPMVRRVSAHMAL